MALNANLIISDGKIEKEVPIEEFFIPPAANILKENVLEQGEIIITVVVPADMRDYISYYFKQKEKHSFDWPLADVAVALKMQGDLCQDARVVLGSAAPGPFRSTPAEQVLNNNTINKQTAQKAAEAAIAGAEPLEMNGYKVPLFKTVIYRTICLAVGIDPIGEKK